MSGGLSARATRELGAWLAHPDHLGRLEFGVLMALWMHTSPRLRQHEPREVEVCMSMAEIRERTAYARWTVLDALDGLEQRRGAVLRTRSIRDPERPAWWLPSYWLGQSGAKRTVRAGVAHPECDVGNVIDSLHDALRWAHGSPRPRMAPRYPDPSHDGTRRLVAGITRAHGATLEQWRQVIASAALDVRDNAAIPYRLDLYAIHMRWDRHLARELEWETMPWC